MCVTYLQAQYRARKLRAEKDGYTWPTIGPDFRSKHTKLLKITPQDNSDTMTYLTKLVLQMMDADSKRDRPANDGAIQISGLLRTVPTLLVSHEFINPVAVTAKELLISPSQLLPHRKMILGCYF